MNNNRRELHIFADDPAQYLTTDTAIEISVRTKFTYTETADAIINGDDVVYTTQMAFLSHTWIRAGYDIYLYDNGLIILFNELYLKEIDADDKNMVRPYYMLDLYKLGELYNEN